MSCFASSIVNGEDIEDEECNPDTVIGSFEGGKLLLLLLLLLVERMVVLETISSLFSIVFEDVIESSFKLGFDFFSAAAPLLVQSKIDILDIYCNMAVPSPCYIP